MVGEGEYAFDFSKIAKVVLTLIPTMYGTLSLIHI